MGIRGDDVVASGEQLNAVDPEDAVLDLSVVELLSESEAFGDLDADTIRSLASCLQHVTAHAGETVIEEGNPPGDAFIVVAGRLQASTRTEDGRRVVVAELGPGEVVGEMALLTRRHRSATVTAMRDTRLLRISDDDFTDLMEDEPRLLFDVTRVIVSRFEELMHGRAPSPRVSVIGVVGAGADAAHRDFAGRFADAGGKGIALVPRARVESDLGADRRDWEVTSYLHRVEADHDLTLLVADERDSDWSRRCLRQADLNFVVGRSAGLDGRAPAPDALEETSDVGFRPPLHLVLMQDGSRPVSTPAALESGRFDRHHHVRLDSDDHLARLGRVVRGATVGLVLSGGGARGFAHVGVLRALSEAGLPIDHVGGTSIGASVAAFHAMDLGWEAILEQERRVTVDQGSLVDFTFPAVSLGRGHRLTSGIRTSYGAMHIEDLWIDYYCVSTDLTAGDIRTHTSGPLWSAVRASVAIPGILPPVLSEEDHVLVDGGVMNNLPTDVMHELYRPSSVIAVDLRASGDLPLADLDGSGVLSGWKVAGRRLAPWRDGMEIPRMIDILTHATAVNAGDNAALADFVFRPSVEEYGMLDFRAWERIFEAGYRHAVDTLESMEQPLVPAL